MRKGREKPATAVSGRMHAWTAAASVVASLAAGCGVVAAATPSAAPAASSAIGNEAVRSIAVSPAFERTGTVLAVSTAASCSADCTHLWASHDRGVTWQRRAARGWQIGRPAIGVNAAGAEVLYTAASSGLLRSDDGGDSWHAAGPAGTVTVSPDFAQNGTLAIAGGTNPDFVVDASGVRQVQGSGGSLVDTSFMLSPSSAAATRPRALLGAINAHTGAGFVLKCSAQLACTTPIPVVAAQKFPSGLTLVASPRYADNGTLFANAGQALYRSTDGGASFTAVTVGQPGAMATATSDVAFDPGSGQGTTGVVAYAAVLQLFKDPHNPASGGVYRTTDAGTTWTRLGASSPLDGGATALAVAPDGRVFAGYMSSGTMTSGLLCWYRNVWAASCGGPAAAVAQSGCTSSPCAPTRPGTANSGNAPARPSGDPATNTQSAGAGAAQGTALAGSAGTPGSSGGSFRTAALAVAVGLGALAAVSFVTRRLRPTRKRGDTGRES